MSKRLENTDGKGEISRYEQFLLFHSAFKRLVQQTQELVWERVKWQTNVSQNVLSKADEDQNFLPLANFLNIIDCTVWCLTLFSTIF